MIEENRAEFEKTGILKWHEAGFKGQGIRIAVLDSQPSMPDYMAETGKYHDPLNQSVEKPADSGHCAYVARVIHEVAPEAEIYMFYASDGIKYIKEHPGELDIANLSRSIIKYPDLGIPLCASSGNEGDIDCRDKIAGADVILVGAWYESLDARAEYSNGGECLTCVGYTNIHVPTPNPGYTVPFSGTSCATPFVTGMLALWMSKVGQKSLAECKEFIQANCIDKKEPGKDNGSGYGLFVLPDPAEVEEEMIQIQMKLDSKVAYVNDEIVALDAAPFAKDNRTYVPIRFVAEALGCKVHYDNTTKEIIIVKE